ncbi:hypothetical protein LguiA_036277 [Lonicera macranthoides]
MASGATCVQRLDGSRDSAIHTKYRISLRSSSMREPRYPLPRVVCVSKEARHPPRAPRTGQRGARPFVCCSLARIAPGVRFGVGEPVSPATTERRRGGLMLHPPASPVYERVRGSFCWAGFDNDPSAGSPTETLLRLLLPLNDKVQWTSRDVAGSETAHVAAIRTLHRTIQSVGATGGVYKGQGRSQRELMTRAY